MRLKSISIENVRSFLDRQELITDTALSIIVGPNGGGKTNLFDALTIVIRKFLIPSIAIIPDPLPHDPNHRKVQGNAQLDQITLEKHNNGPELDQEIILEIEVTDSDIEAMTEILSSRERLIEYSKNVDGLGYRFTQNWEGNLPLSGTIVTISYRNGALTWESENVAADNYVRFLQLHETDRMLREELGETRLAFPFLYLPTNRAQNGVPNSLEISNFDIYNIKRDSDAIHSRNPNSNLPYMALGRLAKIHRETVDVEFGSRENFNELYEIKQITEELQILGYGWSMECTNKSKNSYTIEISKNGNAVRLDQVSSGEKELLSYVFSIFGLGIRDALILVDEPELHLHPAWQGTLLAMFERLAAKTGNQFVLATHSPQFVTRSSIFGVSRVHMDGVESRVKRLDASAIPEARHLLHIVNAENNGKIFFCDRVILVEGMHDELFYNAVINAVGFAKSSKLTEVVRVSGKMLFGPYVDLMTALDIECHVIADFDLLKQLGSPEVRSLFTDNPSKVTRDVILNGKSEDGRNLVDLFTASLASGKWAGTQELWDYILSSRLGPMINLTDGQRVLVQRELDSLAERQIHILKDGQLEDYLPDGLGRKDTAKLIKFLEEPAFLGRLAKSSRDEVVAILTAIFGSDE